MDMQSQTGFSLIEVLVSLLILKVGLLGVLAGQTLAVQQVQDALQRTQAVAFSAMVLNELAGNGALLPAVNELTPYTELAELPSCPPPAQCTAAQITSMQLQQLLSRLQQTTTGKLHQAALCVTPQHQTVQLSMTWQRRMKQQAGNALSCSADAQRAQLIVTASRG